MNLGLILTISLYLGITGFILYKFFKNDMSFDKTMKDIKKTFSNCCIKNKKEVQEKIGKEETKEIEKDIKALDGDCKEPAGFPFDICFDGKLEKEDIELRKKLINILNNRKNVVFDGGKEKLVVPLEATLFLTKSLNPLVNEHGEIQIIAKHKQLSSRLEEVILLLKNRGEIIYKDEQDLLNAIKEMIDEIDESKAIPEEHREAIKAKEEIKKQIEHIEEEKEKHPSHDIEEIVPEQEFFPPEEDEIETHEEIKSKIEEEMKDIIPDTFEEPSFEERIESHNDKPAIKEIEADPFSDDEDPFGEEDDSLDLMDLNSLLEEELSDLNFEEEENQTDIVSFYKELEYKTAKTNPLDFNNIEDSLKKLLSNDSVVSVFFRNLAKTKPIIFNENKEVAFVDQYNVYFAISKIFGLDSKKYIEKFKELKLKDIQKVNKAIAISLDIYLSDLRTEKGAHKEIIEKEGENLFSFGFDFQSKAFKTGLSQEEFDFFRSFPYNNEYKLKGNFEIKEKLPKLITSIEEVEIK